MKKILPLSIAVYGIIIILSCTIIFHLLVLLGIIPSTIVWGGNLADKTQLYTMEGISIAINCLMLFVILNYAGIIKINTNRKFLVAVIWLMFLLFLLNTVGNLLAKNAIETWVFTPLTLLLAIFCFRIAAFEYSQKKSLP